MYSKAVCVYVCARDVCVCVTTSPTGRTFSLSLSICRSATYYIAWTKIMKCTYQLDVVRQQCGHINNNNDHRQVSACSTVQRRAIHVYIRRFALAQLVGRTGQQPHIIMLRPHLCRAAPHTHPTTILLITSTSGGTRAARAFKHSSNARTMCPQSVCGGAHANIALPIRIEPTARTTKIHHPQTAQRMHAFTCGRAVVARSYLCLLGNCVICFATRTHTLKHSGKCTHTHTCIHTHKHTHQHTNKKRERGRG